MCVPSCGCAVHRRRDSPYKDGRRVRGSLSLSFGKTKQSQSRLGALGGLISPPSRPPVAPAQPAAAPFSSIYEKSFPLDLSLPNFLSETNDQTRY